MRGNVSSKQISKPYMSFKSRKKAYALSILRLNCMTDRNKHYFENPRYRDTDEYEKRYYTLLDHEVKKRISGIATEAGDEDSGFYEHMLFTLIDRVIVKSLDFKEGSVDAKRFFNYIFTPKEVESLNNCMRFAYVVSAKDSHWDDLLLDINRCILPYTIMLSKIGQKRQEALRRVEDARLCQMIEETNREYAQFSRISLRALDKMRILNEDTKAAKIKIIEDLEDFKKTETGKAKEFVSKILDRLKDLDR